MREHELIREAWDRLRAAEQKLDAARTRSALSAAAKKLQRAKAELKALEAEPEEPPKPRREQSLKA
jgi:hypothetical protein